MRPARDFLFIQLSNTRKKECNEKMKFFLIPKKALDIGRKLCYYLIFDTYEERKVPQPLENTGLWHFVPWN